VDACNAYNNMTGAFSWGEDVYRESQKRNKMYVDRIRRIVKYNPQPQKWLDVGCAGGGLLQCVSRMGFYVEGIEPGPAAGVVSSKLNFVIHRSDLHGARGLLAAEQYGVVSYFHVLEHVFDPIQELSSARQILSPSGILVIEVPWFNSLSWRVLGTHHRHFTRYHRSYFTPQSLSFLLYRTAFHLIEHTRVPYYVSLDWLLMRKKSPIWLRKWVASIPGSKIVRADLGDVLFVIARKEGSI